MLQLSAQGDYGLILLKELSRVPQGSFLSLSTLAKKRHLPRKYLDQVASLLIGAGIIYAREGRGGGYALLKPTGKIGFIQVLRSLEGNVEPVKCVYDCSGCQRLSACEKKTGWQKVHQELYKILKNKTLADVFKAASNN